MFNSVIIFSLIYFYCLFSTGQADKNIFPVLKSEYLGQKSPGTKPSIFVPGIISTEHHDDGTPIFSPDLTEVYFRIAGKVNGEPKTAIFFMKEIEGIWQHPELLPFDAGRIGGFTHDGNRMFFSAKIPGTGQNDSDHFDIFYVDRASKGWSKPVSLTPLINTQYNEIISSISRNGTIYFEADYPDNFGKMDLYYSRLVNGKYEKPRNLGSTINTERVEVAPAIDPDERYIIYTGAWYPNGSSPLNLFISFKNDDRTWSKPQNISEVNDSTTDKFAGISPDGKYLFWVSHRKNSETNPHKLWNIPGYIFPYVNFNGADIYWISTDIFERYRNP